MTIDEIIAQTVAYLKTLPDGTEIATSDALKASCGFDFDPNGEYLVGNTPVDFEGMFSLDRDIRKAARKAGLKIDDIPVILGRPVGHLADHIHHSGGANLNLIFLLTRRLGEGHRIGSILLAATDGELLILGVYQNLDVGGVVQFSSGLVVELQNGTGNGGNGCGTGLDEVDDSEFFQNRHSNLLLFNHKVFVLQHR